MLRYMPFILVALFIDGLKAIVYWVCFAMGSALMALTPLGAALAGCVAGATASSGVVSGVANCATGAIAGGIISPVGAPIGIGLGIVLSFCISITLGSGFLLLLAFNNLFYFRYAVGGGFAGMLPVLDVLPGWTAMTVLCILRHQKEELALEGNSSALLSLITGSKLGAVTAGIQSLKQQGSPQNTETRPQRSSSQPLMQAGKDIMRQPAPQRVPANSNRPTLAQDVRPAANNNQPLVRDITPTYATAA